MIEEIQVYDDLPFPEDEMKAAKTKDLDAINAF